MLAGVFVTNGTTLHFKINQVKASNIAQLFLEVAQILSDKQDYDVKECYRVRANHPTAMVVESGNTSITYTTMFRSSRSAF